MMYSYLIRICNKAWLSPGIIRFNYIWYYSIHVFFLIIIASKTKWIFYIQI